jgi:hypothetical protein
MKAEDRGGRRYKRKVGQILQSGDDDSIIRVLLDLPGRKVVNSLLSFLLSTDQVIKWSAVNAIGVVVARIADTDMEPARVIMRRLMWNLNDESGGIGWGSPEAMGEILACHEGLAKEYAHVLISYSRKDGNYLEHQLLQRGLLWGIGRLAQARPWLIADSSGYIMPYMESKDAAARGLACWTMGLLCEKDAQRMLGHLADDMSEIQIYLNRKMINCRVMDMAKNALEIITNN